MRIKAPELGDGFYRVRKKIDDDIWEQKFFAIIYCAVFVAIIIMIPLGMYSWYNPDEKSCYVD